LLFETIRIAPQVVGKVGGHRSPIWYFIPWLIKRYPQGNSSEVGEKCSGWSNWYI